MVQVKRVELCEAILDGAVQEGDTRLYFRDLAADLAQSLYPEVVVSWTDRKADLLSLVDGDRMQSGEGEFSGAVDRHEEMQVRTSAMSMWKNPIG